MLTLSGSVTVEDADELHRAFVEAQESVESLTVVLADLTAIDLACFQLFFSAQKSFERAGKGLVFRGRPEALDRFAGEAGIAIDDAEDTVIDGLRWDRP
jgi:anti-anti-sigma regulatory factor